ncbi:MAG: TrkH family potassium uptake protein [Christensenellales bacterium]
MNKKLVLRLLGKLLAVELGLMLPALLVALFYGEDPLPFLYTLLALALTCLPLLHFTRSAQGDLHAREGFVVVGFTWVAWSLFGALPFMISGTAPWFWDALFETVSGFTTTGASVLPFVEGLPHGILFWRSFTHWVGGMGVLVLTLALMPKFSGRSAVLARAESPGPSYAKLLPRMGDTSRVLYLIYASMTVVLIVGLMATGLPLFDSVIHALGTAGTGGFSSRNLSVGAYNNPAAEILIAVFMLLFGTNFLVYFKLLHGDGLKSFKSEEYRAYLLLALVAMGIITVNTLPHYGDFWTSLRHASFQVSSIMSTTGFATDNFDLWPQFSRILLLMLMLIGASAGSTAGGIKVVRLVIMGKISRREITHTLHPRKVQVIKLDGKAVPEEQLNQVGIFLFVYGFLLLMGTLVASIDGNDFITCFSAAASCLSNIGPGLSLVGPHGNFGHFSPFVKFFLSLLMLAGRLEFFPLLVLFHPDIWRRAKWAAQGGL